MTIQAFNTGRQYAPKGQRIAYKVISTQSEPDYQHLSTSQVAFNDVDRMITGIVAVMHMNGDQPSKERVLQCYDAGGYKHLFDQELEDQLANAARAL
ncbi:Uncharacterised protein [Ectopseudomonas mendocina]|uniref:Uncharacterized protein n=1 Tax=Ectopseudomonas mendocina TaxID=300 RepID=A0A379PNH9_ECTME|nr:hypothetical protein [Pseudomonas mendocina]SUE95905.1 Uncharacterised protein [Pseudomonas mendocina]